MTRKRDELLDTDADGIKEFDNDLPRWWLYGFYFTVIFGVVYLINYHVLPTPLWGQKTVAAEWAAEMKAAAAAAPAKPAATATIAALTDADNLGKGKVIFESQTNPCVACHRPDLGGLVGPNLTDDFWMHGCTAAAIVTSIKTGYPTKGMLPYGGGPALDDQQLQQVASYILSKHGSNPANAKAKDPERDVECK